ncbi:ASCH domain-containing protein [Carnobacterium pleistocenium]|uniref:ASCH domain-containing protein n=1 Tax=Carnobacterium pleistocenium TaxID=181073 RepID=UPI0005578C6D|nr:ASCH domain-containing protein [Carnobacterium pleistocenium]
MEAKQMWENFIKQQSEYKDSSYNAWSFGAIPDELAELTLQGIKTATASAYELYALDSDPLPQVNDFNIILDSKDEAFCITKTTKVSIIPFLEVSEKHAFKEGEGDKSLESWRKEHTELFTKWYEEGNLEIHDNIPVVCEEFQVVYK